MAENTGTGIHNRGTTQVNFSNIARNGQLGISSRFPGQLNLKNSIVADNSVGPGDCANSSDICGTITSQGYNHVENVGGATFNTTTGDVTGTDPLLGLLILNDSNSVFIPASNSPVIDTIPNGTNECGTAPFNVDQQSVIRPIDSNRDTVAACEKGAVEVVVSPTDASVSISGRVANFKGRGIERAQVTLTNSSGETRIALTNSFGYFCFIEAEAGEIYIFEVKAKNYQFSDNLRGLFIGKDYSELNFTALP